MYVANQEAQETREEMLTDEGLKTHRDAYRNAIRELHSQNNMARNWPLRYLIRCIAFHIMYHAWQCRTRFLL